MRLKQRLAFGEDGRGTGENVLQSSIHIFFLSLSTYLLVYEVNINKENNWTQTQTQARKGKISFFARPSSSTCSLYSCVRVSSVNTPLTT